MKGFGSTIDPPTDPTPSIPINDSTHVKLVVIHSTDKIPFNGIKKLMYKRVKGPILQMYDLKRFEDKDQTKYSLMLLDGHHYVQATCNSKVYQHCQFLVAKNFLSSGSINTSSIFMVISIFLV